MISNSAIGIIVCLNIFHKNSEKDYVISDKWITTI